MSDQEKSAEQVQSTEATTNPADLKEATSVNTEIEDANADGGFKPFFEDEPTEAELRGETPESEAEAEEKEPEKPAEPEEKAKADEKEKSEKPADEKEKTAEEKAEEEKVKAEEAKEKAETEKKEKPQKQVPHAALHQERELRKELQQKNEDLLRELGQLRESIEEFKSSQEKKEKKPDFQLLSDEEFEELLEEDPTEAIKYQRKLWQWNEEQRQEQDAERQRQERDRRIADKEDALVQASVSRLKGSLPELFEAESTLAVDLTEFVERHGFDNKDYLNAMTDPATRIILPDPKDRSKAVTVPLGEGAVALTEMIHKLWRREKDNNPDKLRETIRAELEAEYKGKLEELQKKIASKFKKDPSSAFADLGEVPTSSDENIGGDGLLTEESYWKMTAAERERALGGG